VTALKVVTSGPDEFDNLKDACAKAHAEGEGGTILAET
jgi:hypothetical protein